MNLNLRILFSPAYWLQNKEYSPTFDKWLQEKIKTHYFVDINDYDAKIDGKKVWISNHPYASFTITIGTFTFRPSRKTIYLARKRLEASAKYIDKSTEGSVKFFLGLL